MGQIDEEQVPPSEGQETAPVIKALSFKRHQQRIERKAPRAHAEDRVDVAADLQMDLRQTDAICKQPRLLKIFRFSTLYCDRQTRQRHFTPI